MYLPRKFPLFFTDELSMFTSFSSSAIVPRTISVIVSSSSLDAEKPTKDPEALSREERNANAETRAHKKKRAFI